MPSREKHRRGKCDKRPGDKLNMNSIRSSKRLKLSPNYLKTCILCEKIDGKLHEFQKTDDKTNIEEMAEVLKDGIILHRLKDSEMVPCYHLPCRTPYTNKYRKDK